MKKALPKRTFTKSSTKIVLALVMLISLGFGSQVCSSNYGEIVVSPEISYGFEPIYLSITSNYTTKVNITWNFNVSLKGGSSIVVKYPNGDWVDLTDQIIYKTRGSNHTYTLLNVPFTAGVTRQAKLNIFPSINTTGKYDIYIWKGTFQNLNIKVFCDPIWNSSFVFRKNITIESKTNEPSYSVKIVLNTTNFNFSQANTTGQDIRFTNFSDDLLPMFIENYSFSDEFAILWFKGNLTAGNRTFWMYYGNNQAVNLSNPNAVFIEYDDFEDDTLNFTRWDDSTVLNATSLNTSRFFRGQQSFFTNKTPNLKKYIMDTTPFINTSIRSLIAETWWFDSDLANSNNWFNCMSQSALAPDYWVGRSGVQFAYRVGGAQFGTKLTKRAGWHHAGCLMNSTAVYYFLTPQQYNFTFEDRNSTPRDWNGSSMGDVNGGGTAFWTHFDFYRVRYFTSGGLIYTFGAGELISEVNVTLLLPLDNSQNVTNATVQFVFNTTSRAEIENASLWTRQLPSPTWAIKQVNQTEITNGTNVIESSDFLLTKEYEWNIEVCDKNNTCNFAPANFTFIYIIVGVAPNISVDLEYPANNSVNDSRTVDFGYNVSSAINIANSTLWSRIESGIWGHNRCNLTAIINGTVNEIPSFNFDTGIKYEWVIQVCDVTNFCENATPTFFFTYNFTALPPANVSISIDIGADQPYTELCTNSTHLERTLEKMICDNVGCTDIKIGENISCPFGCFEDVCAPSPSGASWNILWFFAGMVVLIFVLWLFIGKK